MSKALDITHKIFYESTGMDRARVQLIADTYCADSPESEIYLEREIVQSVSLSDGKIHASSSISQGFGLRRTTLDGKTAYTSSATLTEAAIAEQAKALRLIDGDTAPAFTVSKEEAATAPAHSLYTSDNPILAYTPEQKAALAHEIESYVRSKDARVTQVDVSVVTAFKCVEIIRAGHKPVADIRPLVRLNVSVTASENGVTEDAGEGMGGRVSCSTLFNKRSWQKLADSALKNADALLRAKPAPAGTMTVVLGNAWAGILLHEAVGHGLEADAVRKEASVFAGKIGEQVAARGVTIVDDATMKDRRGSLNVDDEGNATNRNVLIEDGILKQFLSDEMNARLMGTKSTGSGRRENFECMPLPRMNNTFAINGNYTPREIIKSVANGLYLKDFTNGQVDPVSGAFNFNASIAYPIRNGRVMWSQPVKGAALIGSCIDALKKISMVGNDCKLDRGVGTCGKDGQGVPVGVGQPTLRLDGITVGGRG